MQYSKTWLATGVMNNRVRNSGGEDLGKIEDLVIDPQSGNVDYAILSFGGVLGMGNKLFPIPWSAIGMAPSRDYFIVDIDKESLKRAPSFERDVWPDLADSGWRNRIQGHYGRPRPVAGERRVYAERRPVRRGISAAGAILLVCLVLALGWLTYLISTRGWDQARQDITASMQRAAYAAKETSQDATLTAKVKTALSLSKRVPSNDINVDSKSGVVTLSGQVPSPDVAGAVESVVRDVPGVSNVENHLYVAGRSQ
jgi:sporulation protein YlmC with PRC-barrel domain